jgi:hypothetical protein
MTPTLLVVLLLSQAEAPDNPPAKAVEPSVSGSPVEKWRYLARLDGVGALQPGTFASVSLGVDHAR